MGLKSGVLEDGSEVWGPGRWGWGRIAPSGDLGGTEGILAFFPQRTPISDTPISSVFIGKRRNLSEFLGMARIIYARRIRPPGQRSVTTQSLNDKEAPDGLFYLPPKQLDAGESPGISAQSAGQLQGRDFGFGRVPSPEMPGREGVACAAGAGETSEAGDRGHVGASQAGLSDGTGRRPRGRFPPTSRSA